MLSWRKIYYKLFHLKLKLLVRSKAIPSDPIRDLKLDLSQPILYILPYNSKTDLLTLRIQCLAHDLPDPINPLEIDGTILPSHIFIHDAPSRMHHETPKEESIKLFHEYLKLHFSNLDINIQILPISVMFGRSPGRDSSRVPHLYLPKGIQKLLAVLWLGRHSFVHFSNIISLRHVAFEYATDKSIGKKLARLACMHFARQRRALIGPNLTARQDLFNILLASKTIKKAVEEEARSKKISINKAQQNAVILMEEIASNFSYEVVRLSDLVLSWTWRRLYAGINVTNVDCVRQLAQDGHEIIYVPCHRSHIDYLILSYVLYNQGLAPPHIAAGINLNFWPAGPIFRRLGAFFIRRTFKGNKLYSTVFREYLGELFTRGYSVEYFIEGGRSRTGRLLRPKTGTLSMTIQAMLRGGVRPITLVPIYIGYEHVIEASTYAKELRGTIKKKEGLLQLLRSLGRLRNLGQVHINFGDPLPLTTYLNQHVPYWRSSTGSKKEAHRPNWLTPAVNNLAETIMVRINNAAAVNAINLCSTALLASQNYSIRRTQLLEQLECYLQLMRNVPYANVITIPTQAPQELLERALNMNKCSVEHDDIGDVIILSRAQAVLMTYYRNNIYHLLVLPSLIAIMLIHHGKVANSELLRKIDLIYPMLQAELFLHYDKKELKKIIQLLIKEMIRQKLIYSKKEELLPNPARIYPLQLLATGARETLQRYAIVVAVLSAKPTITREMLEKESRTISEQLSILGGMYAPAFLEKSVLTTLAATVRKESHINDISDSADHYILKIYTMLSDLISPEMRLVIEGYRSPAEVKTRHVADNTNKEMQ